MAVAPLSHASDAVALLTARTVHNDLTAAHVALAGITPDMAAWPAVLWLGDVCLSLLGQVTDDVPEAIRRIATAVAEVES